MENATEVIKRFWEIQDEGDYTKLVDLFLRTQFLKILFMEGLKAK